MKISVPQLLSGITKKVSLIAFWLIITGSFSHYATAQTPYNILVLGDSLSAAYRLREDQGWVNLMSQRLTSLAPQIKVTNASISGATTAAGIQTLGRQLSNITPDLVLLELGANDGLQGKPLNYIRRNLERLIQMSQAAGADVILLSIRLPTNYGLAYTEPFYAQYQQLADSSNSGLVPFFLEGIFDKPELMLADGIHPNAKAQPLVLENIWPYVYEFLKRKTIINE